MIYEPDQTVGSLVRRLENAYLTGSTTLSKYVQFDQYDNINTIDAYLNNIHTSGEYDSLGREKPFFNIVKAAVNIWFRATDIDTKDIRLVSTSNESLPGAYLLNIKLQQWMRDSRFGTFLKDWGIGLARYGSVPVKFVTKGKDLTASVVAWNRMISDTIDFNNNIKIEILELTEAQLRGNKAYDQDQVDALVNAKQARRLIDRQQQDNLNDYYRLYEVHGELSVATLKMAQGKDPSDKDANDYVQQMHVLSFVATDNDNEFDDFTLYSGREARDPYMITHLIKEDGRAQSIGAVEDLFQAQWMVNHTQKAIKDQMDIASKVIFQTADQSFISQNALQSIENGDILTYKDSPLSTVQTNPIGIQGLEAWQNMWQNQAKEITGTPDAVAGNTMPSGTAYRQVAVLNQEANSLFDIMTKNKGLHIEDMVNDYVLPHLMKQLDNKDQIVTTLGEYGVTQIQSMYVTNEAIKRRKQTAKDILLGKAPLDHVPEQQDMENQVQGELNTTGSQRFISPSNVSDATWKEILKDTETTCKVETTNENGDKNAQLTTLNTLLSNVISLQGRPMGPEEAFIFHKIMDVSGVVSPLEIAQLENEAAQQQAQAAQQQNQPQQRPPIETIAFKDLPPEGQQQMAAQVGIKLSSQPAQQPAAPAMAP